MAPKMSQYLRTIDACYYEIAHYRDPNGLFVDRVTFFDRAGALMSSKQAVKCLSRHGAVYYRVWLE